MIESVEVIINGRKKTYNKGIALEEIAQDYQDKFKYPIILARVENRLKELSFTVEEPCTIEFLDLTSKEGNNTHINGLVYVMVYAVKKLYGKNANIIVEHSLDKGVYIESTFKLTEEKVKEIKDKMKEIIADNKPIIKNNVDRMEAMKYFEKVGDTAKAGVMSYSTNNYVTLYRLGNLYNYFYNLMPISTGLVKDFDLTYIKGNGFILRFPTVFIQDKIKKYEHHEKLFEVFKEYRDWGKKLNISTSVDLNRIVSLGKTSDMIKIDSTVQDHRILSVAREISERKNDIKIVLIAGPSSSGKTTTSKKLCMYLQMFGIRPNVLSMDDYFKEREDNPKNEDGSYDYECLEALDLKLFDKQIEDLLKGEEVVVPDFNFTFGIKEYNRKVKLDDNEILVIEGIHALDDKILTKIQRNKKYKIYISPLTEVNVDDHNRISTADNRLLRRIIRDNRTRSYTVEETLEAWQNVRNGEEIYVFPFQDDSDVIVNTASVYEIGVLKTYVEPLLYSVDIDSPYYEEAKRLLDFLKVFLPIPSDAIPEDAILREFIGGSYFESK
ncbi:MAG: nucleoside kinase [Bacilli bacterium]|nr:nucleoside kinase [Bacilli bacterium]